MEFQALVSTFPRVWHATFPGGWDLIRRDGLRPARDLLGAAGRADDAGEVRAEILALALPEGGVAHLRDQKPGRRDLAPYLDGVSPEQWWDLINCRVYLFPHETPLKKLLRSYAERGHAQDVITFDTARLLRPVADRVELAAVNAGVFPREAGRTRGVSTFQPLAKAAFPVMKVKEVTVVGHLPVPEAAVVKVVSHAPDGVTQRLWP